MKIIDASVALITPIDGNALLRHIEECGRVCYKSEGRITAESAPAFVDSIIKHGHEAVLEHASFTAKFICDRGVSHEIVRNRLAAYCQESTRYCNYSKDKFGNELTFIRPFFFPKNGSLYKVWKGMCEAAEITYMGMLELGATPQEARSVLPNSLKTEVIMTADVREWRHFLKLRCAGSAHPQMREVASKLLSMLREMVPVLFDDIEGEIAHD